MAEFEFMGSVDLRQSFLNVKQLYIISIVASRREREKASSHQCINAQQSFIQSSVNFREMDGTGDCAKQNKLVPDKCCMFSLTSRV